MSMSTRVEAFRDMDGEFAKMLRAKTFCDEQHLSYPKEAQDYFGKYAGYNEAGLRDAFLLVDIDHLLTEYHDGSSDGFELEVARLPQEVKTLRFFNCW